MTQNPNPTPNTMAVYEPGGYVTVAASQDDMALSATGALGNYLKGILIIPATTSPGSVVVTDGTTDITVFAGGASSLADLKPFFVPLGVFSATGAWSITTGANLSVIAVGRFT